VSDAGRAPRALDVGGRVAVSDPDAVCAAAREILARHYPGADLAPLELAFADARRLYQGEFPGYRACDVPYHDLRHVLGVTLAMARLLDGYLRSHAGAARFAFRQALLGIVVALFHDAGYIRRRRDTRRRCGAEYTRIHVARSARFLAAYLPGLGLAELAGAACRLVQFTGYEQDAGAIDFADARLRRLGQLIGSADIIAQMADPAYLDNCRDRLYPEFALGGIAAAPDRSGRLVVRYADALDLLRQTPAFMEEAIVTRLDRVFEGLHRHVAVHFGGRNPYMESIERQRARLLDALRSGDADALRRPFHVPDAV